MGDLPKHVDRRVRQAIADLDRPYSVVKKRDHYFVQVGDHPALCIGSNSSKQDEFLVKRTLRTLEKLGG